jgi:hypothetical protein
MSEYEDDVFLNFPTLPFLLEGEEISNFSHEYQFLLFFCRKIVNLEFPSFSSLKINNSGTFCPKKGHILAKFVFVIFTEVILYFQYLVIKIKNKGKIELNRFMIIKYTKFYI